MAKKTNSAAAAKQTAASSKQAPVSTTVPLVGDMLIHYLQLEGVTHIFGIPGGGLMHFLVNLKDNKDKINYVICRQETGAAYIADGYYRATGKLGVMAVTTGPGATNALTGLMNAQSAGSAVMLISGEIDEKFYGMGYLQEGIDAKLDLNAVFNSSVGYSSVIASGAGAETIMKQALRCALALPRNAVQISLPVNVTQQPIAQSSLPVETSVYRTTLKGAHLTEVRKAMKALTKCKRPLLFLGNGCRQSLANPYIFNLFLEFVEAYGIPVITTADAKGIFPESHDLSLRVYGIADCMWPYTYLKSTVPVYDGIMIIGSALGELSTNSWLPILIPPTNAKNNKPAPFIQVDINQKIIARSFEVTQGIVGEAGSFISDLHYLMRAGEFLIDKNEVKERKEYIASIKAKNSPFIDPVSYNSKVSPIEPAALMRVLQNTLPKTSKIFIDAGNCVGWSVHYLAIDNPHYKVNNNPGAIYTSLAMGPMGFGVCAVIGGKIGCPDDTCVSITGDGAFMMQGSEISTASQNQIGAIWIVLSDNNLSMVSQGMKQYFPDSKNPDVWTELYELGNPNLEMYSKSMGAEAYTINSPAELEKIMPDVIKRANIDKKPQVIIANINREQVPPYYNPIYK